MAKFLTTRGTTTEIERIINDTQRTVVLISPFIKIPDSLFQNIFTADKRGVTTTIVYGKKGLEAGVLSQLNRLTHLRKYFLENLHAKCYFNEQFMVITSLNLYDFSESNNREMGVLLSRIDDKDAYELAVREANMIVSLAKPEATGPNTIEQNAMNYNPPRTITLPKESKAVPTTHFLRGFSDIISNAVNSGKGYCIGCKTRKDYDEYKPLCPVCYKQWAKNKVLKANYCHMCGKPHATSVNKPVCLSCYKNSSDKR